MHTQFLKLKNEPFSIHEPCGISYILLSGNNHILNVYVCRTSLVAPQPRTPRAEISRGPSRGLSAPR
jgi:hypothetical protein